jgi:hypothetical protein
MFRGEAPVLSFTHSLILLVFFLALLLSGEAPPRFRPIRSKSEWRIENGELKMNAEELAPCPLAASTARD